MANIFKNLNEKQKEAVMATEGPVLVIAGPGSGKTRVLTHRIAYIIETKKAQAENILAVAFTNKAAKEMKNRVEALLGEISRENNTDKKEASFPADDLDINQTLNSIYENKKEVENNNQSLTTHYSLLTTHYQIPTISTFHGLCVKILRKEAEFIGYKKEFIIFDDDDQKSCVKKILKRLNLSDEQFNPRALLSEIGKAKNELLTPESYGEIAESYFQQIASKVYDLYQKELRQNNSLDFDDLIMQTIILFLKHPEILEKYQDKFRYIMVDEYQDTNHAQYKLINLLSRKYKNIFVVGDDWQSIYRWRGADIRNILEFEKNYPGAKTILLEQNYRSTQEILDVSYSIISKNINRKEKKLWSEKKASQPIIVYEAANEKGEAEFIVSQIAKMNSGENIKLRDIAILYRTNAQSRAVEETFLRYNVPYKIVGGVKFYARREIKNLIAYFRLIQNSDDLASFERIANVPKRGLGKTTLEKLIIIAREKKLDIINLILESEHKNITKKRMADLVRFANLIKECREKSSKIKISELLEFLLENINYKDYIIDGTEEGDDRWKNVQELFTALEKYGRFNAKEALKLFTEEVALATDLDNMDDNHDAVTLMTLHSAKGLEYDAVFIIGLEEGLLPHSLSIDNPAEIEEERRLCYVGITRAKSKVHLLFARVRRIFGGSQANYPSRFIYDIPKHLIDFQNQEYSYLRDEDDFIEID